MLRAIFHFTFYIFNLKSRPCSLLVLDDGTGDSQRPMAVRRYELLTMH